VSGVDDLFTDERAAPARDRLGRARALVAVAAPLVVLGPACFTGVPGALLALVAWQFADEELARAESGGLPADRARPAARLRGLAFGLLSLSILSFVLQIFLFAIGFYASLLELVVGLVRGDVPSA